jgi:hypothetical protein
MPQRVAVIILLAYCFAGISSPGATLSTFINPGNGITTITSSDGLECSLINIITTRKHQPPAERFIGALRHSEFRIHPDDLHHQITGTDGPRILHQIKFSVLRPRDPPAIA